MDVHLGYPHENPDGPYVPQASRMTPETRAAGAELDVILDGLFPEFVVSLRSVHAWKRIEVDDDDVTAV